MSNWCASEVKYTSNDTAAVKQLCKDICEVSNNKMIEIAKLTSFYGNDEDIAKRGCCEFLDFDEKKNVVHLFFETAWGPYDDLYDFIADHYRGMRYVYVAIEEGNEVYINTDKSKTFFPQRYILDDEEDGMQFFNNVEELLEAFNAKMGTHLRTLTAAVKYAREWSDTHDEYLSIHEFED